MATGARPFHRAWLATIAAGVLVAASLVARSDAQTAPGAGVRRLGVLAAAGTFSWPLYAGFREELRALGYEEGRNLVVEFRSAEGRVDRLPALAEELVRLRPDVIVAPSTPAAMAAQRVSRSVPIVFALAADPVGSGLAASLARPGGNATGLSILNTELAAKRLDLLKEAMPALSRVAVLWAARDPDPAVETLRAILRETEAAARRLGLALDVIRIHDAAELEGAFATIGARGHRALVVLPTPIFTVHAGRVADLSLKAGVGAVADGRQFAEAGGLLAYGASYPDQMRRAARYVDRILRGARPDALPIEQATRFELVLNLKTAGALGLTIPPPLLLRADQVIE